VADRKLAPDLPAAAGASRPTDVVVLETVPAVVVVLDAQGGVVDLNRAGEELAGYSGEEIRGRKLWETGLVPEEEQSVTREVFARLRAGDCPNRYENHWITRDGRWRLLSWRNSAVLDEYGEVSCVIGAAVDVTDERRALDALQESAERFRATLQTLIDPLVLLTAARDADGSVVDFVYAFANDAACAVHGVAREGLIGRCLLGFLPEARSSGLFDAFVRVIETGEPFSRDDFVFAVGGDGEQTERQLIVRATSVGDQVAVTWIDATERRRIEARVEAGEQRFDAAVGSMLDSVTIVSPVRGDDGGIVDFRYEYVNDAHCALVGFDREQLLGHRLGELFPQYPGSDRFEVYRRVAVTGEPCRTDDVRHEGAWAGTPLATRVVDTIIASMGEDLVVSARDVTERRRSEEELRLRAELLDLAHDAVIVRDPAESRVTFWNREAQAIYGYSPEEALGQVTHELLATVFPESRGAVDDALVREGRWVGELRHTRKDGTVIVVSSRQALQRGSDGRPSAIIELNSDIAERKRVEEELAHIAGLLERTEEVSKTGGWEYDVATGELTWTDEVFRIYGVERTSDATEVTQAIAAYDPESAPIIDAAFKRLVDEGVPYDLELGLIRADGQRVWVRTIGRPVIDDGRIVRVGGNISDVTERRRVEEALRASDQLFHSGFDHSPTGMALTGLDGSLVEANAAFARMLDYEDPAQLAGQDFARYTHPEDVAANHEGIRLMVEEGKPYVAEKRYIRRDGAVVYALMGSTAVLDADGRPSMLFTQVQDITERKQAEAALRASEERFRGGFENSPIGMALVDLNGRYLEVNATHARMLGVDDPREMIGLSFEDFVHPDDVADTYASIKRLHETGTDHGERRYIGKDGATVYALFGSSVVRDADGQPSVLFSQVEDITDRTLAEAALRTSEERFRGGFETSPIGMALVGLDGRYLEVNATLARMLGFADPAELAGQSFTTFIHPDEVALAQAAPQRVSETGAERGERRYIRTDGAVVYTLYTGTLVRDADGQALVFFAQLEDITERKLAEAEVHRLNAELEQRVLQRTAELRAANQELEGFAYSLAHDLRTPIRAISAFGAVLARNHGDQLGDQGRETLERIRRASARMGELIDAMLLLSDLTRRELSLTSVDLSAAAREVSEELRAVDPARRVEFVIGEGLETVGDLRLVRVVMRNLLGNAWKFTSTREDARIEVMRAGAGVFAVRDNGVGFNMDFAGLLFKPFARLHREDEFPGVGVGLTTVERIVRRHGGAVWGEGRPGEGATFYFKLEPPTETGS
jgi:PAS domain S-box-containing protein